MIRVEQMSLRPQLHLEKMSLWAVELLLKRLAAELLAGDLKLKADRISRRPNIDANHSAQLD